MSVFKYVKKDEPSLVNKEGGKFGLNHGFLTKLELNHNAGKDNSGGIAVDINVKIKDRIYMSRIFDITNKPLYGPNEQIFNPGDEIYDSLFESEMTNKLRIITDYVTATGVSEENVEKVLTEKNPENFVDYVSALLSLLPPINEIKAYVDVFLEYQWSIKEGQKRTFLQIPQKRRDGIFIVQGTKNSWQEVKEDGLFYVNPDGEKHEFERSSYFMSGNKAIQQIKEEEETMKTTSKVEW